MKNVKVLFALLVVALATLFIYSCAKDGTEKQSEVMSKDLQTETRVAEPCENVMANCGSVIWTQKSATGVIHPDYIGCTFEISYRVRTCPTNKFDLEILSWGPWRACCAFEADRIAAGIGVGLFLQKIERDLMVELVNITLDDPIINANIPLCGTGSIMSIGFSVGSCVKFCFVPISSPMGDYTKMTYVKIPCGDACCRTSFEICREPSGKIRIDQSTTQGTHNCTAQVPQSPCPIISTGSTVCVPNCQEI